MLATVETLKQFRNILLGQKIVVHTDHKNLTAKTFNTDRVVRWCLILEECSPELRYIQGQKNIVADALSRLKLEENISKHEHMMLMAYSMTKIEPKETREEIVDIKI